MLAVYQYRLNMANPCDFRARWTYCYCMIGLVFSVLLYFVVLSLSWGFAEGIPLEVHNYKPDETNNSLAAAVALTLPAAVFIAALCCVMGCDNEECGDSGFICAAFSWGCACCCSGTFSAIGAGYLFLAASSPPPPNVFNTLNYTVFAVITGVLASAAAIVYCCSVCGYGLKRFDGKNCVWQNSRYELTV